MSFISFLPAAIRSKSIWEAKDGEIGCEVALGQGTLLRLKNVIETASIPVLMIGGTGLSSEATWKIRGAAGFVPKPFRMNQLLAAVEQILTNPKADFSQCDD